MHDDAVDGSTGVTLVQGARWVVAWDPDSGGHVYRTGADVVFADGVLTQCRAGLCGAAAGRTIDAAGCLVMPGLVDIHTHLFSEPINKAVGRGRQSAPLQHLTLLRVPADPATRPEGTRAAYGVALAELALSASPPSATRLAERRLARSPRRFGPAGLYRPDVPVGPLAHPERPQRGVRMGRGSGPARPGAGAAEIATAERHPSGRLRRHALPGAGRYLHGGAASGCPCRAVRRDLRFHTHGGAVPVEFHEITRRTGMTPIEWLDDLGVLTERTIVGHGSSSTTIPGPIGTVPGSDMRRLSERGATVAHCPTVFARRGIALNHFGRYVQSGSTWHRTDVLPAQHADEMRLVSYLARVVAENPRDTRAADVFHAATVGRRHGARAHRHRPLAPGCKADFVLVDCAHPAMRPCRDPCSR